MSISDTATLIFCATDPGGARNIAPVARLAAESFHLEIVCSPQTRGIFEHAELDAEATTLPDTNAARRFLESRAPASIIVGTSAADRPEALLTIAARELCIPSVAVLDEWYYYAARFADPGGTFTHLADMICCQDELAKSEAMAEGIPADHLRITGSPALADVYRDIQSHRTTAPPTDPTSSPQIVFISEQIAKAFGEAPGERGFVGPFIGYTETTVRNELATALPDIGTPVQVFEKLHPNETDIATPPDHGPAMTWRILEREVGLRDAMSHADAVIGMRSIGLLDAALMGFRPACYQPGRIGSDHCTAARLGLADSIDSPDDLKDWLKNAIAGQRSANEEADVPAFATPDAAANIYEVVRQMAAPSAMIEEEQS